MNETLDLNASWSYAWTEFQGPADNVPRLNWRSNASVPGDVHLDLMRDGLLPDPFVGMNADHALWIERKDWWFRRSFPTSSRLQSRRALLVFHGLDNFATVWLNGVVVGRSANMFIRHEFDVTHALKPSGDNEVLVRLASPARSIPVDPSHSGITTWNSERLFCRKPQMSFGWDIAPRLVTVGIWRPVQLLLLDSARITDFHVALLRFDRKDALVRLDLAIDSFASGSTRARLTGSVHNTPWEAQLDLQPGSNSFSHELRVAAPPRWFPIGVGKPALCSASVSLESEGQTLDSRSLLTGLRTIALVQEPQPSGATSFRFRCNDRDFFVTGLNWTPLDPIFARVTPERITLTLERLARIGCNMLRVWGGGIYEPPHFYAECDRLGIMIWQDFMMACGWFPQTDAFANALDVEARQVVADLRNHPCIALWAGDNECDIGIPEPPENNRLTRKVLPRVCRDLAPDVPYLPSSPTSPSGADWSSQTEGDLHWYCHGLDYRKCDLWTIRCRFMSEFGRLSLPSLKVIRKYFPKGTAWPLTSPMWRYHASDTTRTGFFRGADKILAELKACGRPEPANIAQAVKASQELQAEAVVALIERYCEDPEFGGFLLWNVADCWPQQSDSIIDCDGHPKLLYKKLAPLFRRLQRARRSSNPR